MTKNLNVTFPNMTTTLADVARICHADVVGKPDTSFSEIVTDSRRLFVPARAIFFALHGERHDGENYIPDLYARGMRAFVCRRGFNTTPYPEASFLLVDSPINALQAIAAAHRQKMPAHVVAICGSNGKTIVKEWLSQLIADDMPTVRSPRSYNSQVGVPLSVLR